MTAKPARKYQEIWEQLKKSVDGKVKVEVSLRNGHNQLSVINTINRGVQKEKYNDINFRCRNPFASLKSELEQVPNLGDTEENFVFVTFILTNYLNESDLL